MLAAHRVDVVREYDACAAALVLGDRVDVVLLPVPVDIDCMRLLRLIRNGIGFTAPAVVLVSAGDVDARAAALARQFGAAGVYSVADVDALAVVVGRELELDPARYRLLLVEDYPDTANLIEQLVDTAGLPLDIEVYRTAAGGWSAWQARRHDLALLDLHLPDYRGDQLMAKMLAVDPSMVCIIASAHIVDPRRAWSESIPLPLQFYRAGAWEQIVKPFTAARLRQALVIAVQHLQSRGGDATKSTPCLRCGEPESLSVQE